VHRPCVSLLAGVIEWAEAPSRKGLRPKSRPNPCKGQSGAGRRFWSSISAKKRALWRFSSEIPAFPLENVSKHLYAIGMAKYHAKKGVGSG
jgi:hypothetical protein